jgi:hypothetical protein
MTEGPNEFILGLSTKGYDKNLNKSGPSDDDTRRISKKKVCHRDRTLSQGPNVVTETERCHGIIVATTTQRCHSWQQTGTRATTITHHLDYCWPPQPHKLPPLTNAGLWFSGR